MFDDQFTRKDARHLLGQDPYLELRIKSLFRNALSDIRTSPSAASNIETCLPLANLIAGLLSIEIRFAIRNLHILVPEGAVAGDGLYPPSPANIPFSKLMKLPLPFSSGSAKKFNSSHLRIMASQDFFEDGEWVGYCANSILDHNYNLFSQRPMRGIFFQTSHASVDGKLRLDGRGYGASGHFQLRGTLNVNSGSAELWMVYANIHAFRWAGTMTPFGLVGCFADVEGWFWIWKASWSRQVGLAY